MTTRQRVQRIGEEIKKEAAEIIRNMKDPRVGFVTVTDVEVSNDLSHVKIFVSIYGDDEAKDRSLEGLQAAKGFIRTEIGKAIRLRHTPEIAFKIDPSLERGARISQIISDLAAEQTAEATSDESGRAEEKE